MSFSVSEDVGSWLDADMRLSPESPGKFLFSFKTIMEHFDAQLFEGDPVKMATCGEPARELAMPMQTTSLWDDLCEWLQRLGSSDTRGACPGADEHQRLVDMLDDANLRNRNLSLQVLETKVRLDAAERKSAELEAAMSGVIRRFDHCLGAMEEARAADLSVRTELQLREVEERLVRKLDSNFTRATACIDKRLRKEREERKAQDREERAARQAEFANMKENLSNKQPVKTMSHSPWHSRVGNVPLVPPKSLGMNMWI
jgi:hypothetical protein